MGFPGAGWSWEQVNTSTTRRGRSPPRSAATWGRAAGPGSPRCSGGGFFFFPQEKPKISFFFFKAKCLPAFIIIIIIIFKAFGIFVVVLHSGHANKYMGYQFPEQDQTHGPAEEARSPNCYSHSQRSPSQLFKWWQKSHLFLQGTRFQGLSTKAGNRREGCSHADEQRQWPDPGCVGRTRATEKSGEWTWGWGMKASP